MSTAKETKTKETAPKYKKADLLKSKRFRAHKDLINALLKDSETYTIDTVNRKIQNFLEREV